MLFCDDDLQGDGHKKVDDFKNDVLSSAKADGITLYTPR